MITRVNYSSDELKECVIDLHHLAGVVEKNFGTGDISQSLRELADKISDIVKGEYGKSSRLN